MLEHPTADKLAALKLAGMLAGYQEQMRLAEYESLPFEERFGLLVDRETLHRENRRMATRLKQAKLREDACVENIDFRQQRSLDRSVVLSLASCQWIRNHRNCLITGPTGVGKTYLACALAHKACREGFTVRYDRLHRLLAELRSSTTQTQTYLLWQLRDLAKIDLLVLDDLGVAPLTLDMRRDLLELLDDRFERKSTLITSQLPVERWHDFLEDPTLADAILDRLVHNAHRLALTGESMRRVKAESAALEDASMRNVTHNVTPKEGKADAPGA